MDTKNSNDDRNQSTSKGSITTKLRGKERNRSQVTPTNTDINDPENLDYEDIDDNHQPNSLDDNHDSEQINDPVKTKSDDTKIANEDDKPQEINNNDSSSINKNQTTESDEGELDEADLEDGEIHDPSTSKTRIVDDSSSEQNRNQINTNVPSSPQAKVHCRFFLQGRCHWGPNCKYIHPSNDSIKGSSGSSLDVAPSANSDVSSPTSTGIPLSLPPTAVTNSWISPQATTAAVQFFSNATLRVPVALPGIPLVAPPTGTESAWERGLRSAKRLREQSMRRKQQDKDFNDKKFNLTVRDEIDDKDPDDNFLNINRSSPIDYDSSGLPGANYGDSHSYSDRYHSYTFPGSSSNSHFNNHSRLNNNSRHNNNNNNVPVNDHSDRRSRHTDDYNDNRTRKENTSSKSNKSTSKKDDSSSYKRNSSQQQYSSGSHHNNDVQTHFNPYSNRRGDDWHDPWDRSRNHGSSTRRLSGGGREPSYSSSSSASSSSSRSSHSRSHSTTSSSRSRSRSRSRPKRRSPSVTRATRPTPTRKSSEMVKNGNEKKSNSNKKLGSPSSTTNKFLPGRQISSHTLKKAEKSSNSSNSSCNNHAKDQHVKDSDINLKRPAHKEKNSRSDSTSSSSSSDSDTNRLKHRSSSSSSDSSSSENDIRTSMRAKGGSGGSKSTVGSHSTKSVNRQISSSSGAIKSSKPKNDSTKRESPSASAKKRRDTSSSIGSTSATKKTKLNTDSHKSSTDAASNAEASDSCKKKEKQKILKKLQEVEKLINERSTKTSS